MSGAHPRLAGELAAKSGSVDQRVGDLQHGPVVPQARLKPLEFVRRDV